MVVVVGGFGFIDRFACSRRESLPNNPCAEKELKGSVDRGGADLAPKAFGLSSPSPFFGYLLYEIRRGEVGLKMGENLQNTGP